MSGADRSPPVRRPPGPAPAAPPSSPAPPAASARPPPHRLAAEGFDVVVGARRLDRLTALAGAIGGRAAAAGRDRRRRPWRRSPRRWTGSTCWSTTRAASFDAAPVADGRPRLVGAHLRRQRAGHRARDQGAAAGAAGGAARATSCSSARPPGWSATRAAASYTAAKHGVHTLAETLRLELNGEPVRVIEIAPGMVRTDEFALNRLGGDAGEGRRRLPRACASRWSPRTSPTASPGRSPGRTTSTST